jgi:hypothetical protein
MKTTWTKQKNAEHWELTNTKGKLVAKIDKRDNYYVALALMKCGAWTNEIHQPSLRRAMLLAESKTK